MYKEFYDFVSELDKCLSPDINFDIIKREILTGERRGFLYFVDGFIKDEVYEKILEYLFNQTKEDLDGIEDMQAFSHNKMPYVEVDTTHDVKTAVTNVLSGPAVLVIEGISGALLIDTRTYPTRGIEEPQKDRSLRGSRDGFVETLVFNTALIRRRIRTDKLKMEYHQVGENSKVDVVVSYIDGLADKKTVDVLVKRLKEIKVKGISMTNEALSECLLPHSFFNPFPRFKFTERPDYASAAILDGKIVLIMDNSPSVMIIPDSFADFLREVDDYYFSPLVSTYTRILRFLVTVFTCVATPIYLLLINNPDFIPVWLSFIKIKSVSEVPLIAQFIILELVVDGLRLASLNTPDTLSNSLGIIGGLILSEFAVEAGWFVGEAILLMAFVTIASYTQPSFEMSYAVKFERILLLILSQLFGLVGFIAGAVGFVAVMLCTKTLSGRGYLYPIFPFDLKAFSGLFIKRNIKSR